jgi:hypothetical protein
MMQYDILFIILILFQQKAVGSLQVYVLLNGYLSFSLFFFLFILLGIKKISSEILLQAFNAPIDIHIAMLSDGDFTEVTKLFGSNIS